MENKVNYGTAILQAFEYLLENYENSFVIGQGLWSPWYVGNSMSNLDKKFGVERIIDTPVSESAVTGMAVGASLAGALPIVVHPRIDFMLYAMDSIVNQAAKWSHMTGAQSHPAVTIRGIINRGGEQGAQHSQSLHSWFSHIPGLRVLMPYSVADARDMLISATICKDPVIYIDDRWLYETEEVLQPIKEKEITEFRPKVIKEGVDISLVATSFSTKLAMDLVPMLEDIGINAEVIDVRSLNPFDPETIVESVKKTGRVVVIDGSWKNCGFSSEVITSVVENIESKNILSKPIRINIAESPAPTSKVLEELYYPKANMIFERIRNEINF
tara:strand:- start:820 stop:1806 length:987 start_codon:yes stop_codon:yes gene_type:complete